MFAGPDLLQEDHRMLRLEIPDMHCGGCVNRVTRAVRSLDPAATVAADLDAREITVSAAAAEPDIKAALAAAGYPARAVSADGGAGP